MRPRACTTEDLVRRLHKIEGQVRGIGRMVEAGERELDVLTQLAAIRGALDAVAVALVAAEINASGVDDDSRTATIDAVARLVRL